MPRKHTDLPPLIQRMERAKHLQGVEYARALVELAQDPDAVVLTIDEYAVLIRQYAGGMKVSEIAAEFGLFGHNGDISRYASSGIKKLRKLQQGEYVQEYEMPV